MPSPIIVGVALRDDDRAPLALADALAGLTGAPLALVTPYPYGGSPWFVTPEWINSMRVQAQHALATIAEGISGDVEVTTHVRPEMSPALALHDVAIELNGAAIVVGSCHRGAIGGTRAGGQCRRWPAARGALSRRDRPARLRASGGRAAPGRRRLRRLDRGRSALAAASGIARASGGRVTVFAVEEPIPWSPAMVTPGWSFPRAHEPERDAHVGLVAEKAGRLLPADVLASVEAPVGTAGTILAERSAELDLLVCGSRGYGALRSVALGSVSRMLAHSAQCPVLIVPRPPAEDATKLWHGQAREGVTAKARA